MNDMIDFIIKAAILTLALGVMVLIIRFVIVSLIRTVQFSKKQNLSVIARYRNKVTEAAWKDLMDVRIAGIVPVGESVENFLYAMFPRAMDELETMRTKNPVAWREVMVYFAPLMLRIKATAHYKGQDALASIINQIEGFTKGPSKGPGQSDTQTDKASVQGIDQRNNRGGT